MAARRGQKVKLLYIIKILTKHSDEEHPLSATEICNYLNGYGVTAERKAIYDDIECLISYGYDIIQTRSPKSGYFLGQRDYELPEIFLLGDAVRTARFISEKKTRELISKLDGMLSEYQCAKRDKSIYIDGGYKTKNEEIFYNIDKINTAIEKRVMITLKYGKRVLSDGREIVTEYKDRKVSPYAMTWQDDHYYLIGNYDKYDNLMHLRIDRMRSVEITDESIRPFSEVSGYIDIFDVADYTKKLFGMFGGKETQIKLRCNKSMLEQAADRFGEGIFITNVTDDSFEFSVTAALSEGLVTWLMNYGDNVEVLFPQSLRSMLSERARKITEIYNKN